MPVLNRRIDTAQIATIAAGLDREGFVCVEGIVDQEWLNRALAHVMALIGVEGQRWFVVIRPGDTPGTPPFEFVQHPDIVALMDGLAEHARPAAFSPGESV